jgi:hypothetical protein
MAVLRTALLLLAISISKSTAQNPLTDVCIWAQLRAAIVRGALYVNGGYLTTNENGSDDGSLNGTIYAFNLSQSFNTSNTAFPTLFTPLPGQSPTADYVDGTMFATNDKVYLYGYADL